MSELPPLPAAFATLHHDDGYFTMPKRDENMGRVFRTNAYTAEQMQAYARAAVQAAQPEAVPYERWLAIREGHFNAASEEYFAARPQLDSAANRRIFYAGHCKGYDASAPTPEPMSAPTAEPGPPIQECYGDCPTDPATCPNPCNFKGRRALATPPSAATPEPSDAERLDYVVKHQAFIVPITRDGSIHQFQLAIQNEDEEYIYVSGEDRFFNTEREAIDAAIRATKGGKL